MEGNVFKSKYDGVCTYCKAQFKAGDPVRWDRTRRGIVYHAECKGEAPEQSMTAATVPAPTAAPGASGNAFQAMADALAPLLVPMVAPLVKPAIDRGEVLDMIESAIAGQVNPVLTVEVKRPDGDIKAVTPAHPMLAELLELVNIGENVYLWGPPGSGKSTAAKQCSDALGLRWGYMALNPQTPESRVLGYWDAKGTYIRTLFRDLYENGGVFCFDEMDNASAALVTTLNSGLENGHMAFPDAVIARHADFVLVATGNTNGKGGNAMFPERRPFDAAFHERFVTLFWAYDEALESALTLAVNPDGGRWLEWVRKVRAYCAANFPRVVVSPRASIKGARLLGRGTWKNAPEKVAEMVIFKGADRDTVKKILAACPVKS